jgi:hypothetical protein
MAKMFAWKFALTITMVKSQIILVCSVIAVASLVLVRETFPVHPANKTTI